MKKIEVNILAYVMDAKANEHHIQQAVKKLYGTGMVKVTLP